MNINKKFCEDFTKKFGTENVYLKIIYISTIIIIAAILLSKNYLFQSVVDKGIFKKNIVANQRIEVIDTEKTEQRKKEIANRVDPILTPFHDEHIINNYANLIASIDMVRKSSYPIETKRKELLKLIEISDTTNEQTLDYILNTSNASYQKLTELGMQTLEKLLTIGVSESIIKNNLDEFLDQNISSLLSPQQTNVAKLLIKQVIIPNMIVDEIATDVAKQNAMNSIKPTIVVFEKGEQIVFEGEFISKLKKDALKKAGYKVANLNWFGVLGIFALIAIVSYCLNFYLKNLDEKYKTVPYIGLISLLSIIMCAIAALLPNDGSPYILPFAAYTIILSVFINPTIGFLTSILLLLLIGIALGYSVEVMTTFVLSIMMTTFAVGKLNFLRRTNLAQVGIFVCAIQAYVIFATYLLNSNFNSANFVDDMTAGIISGLLSGAIALGIIPLLESMFKLITPYGLAELADHNQELLKRLQFEAPGTYHHSLMVSNLAEAAAEAIGANPILARVGSFYHDIGKLKRPLFFAENQSYFSIENPHEKLNPRLSKMIITSHPKDGIDLAKEYCIPAIIQKFILEHHGSSIAAYFYNQAKQQEGNEVKKEQFRYLGPKPSMKETAILMLADAAESAVRALNNPTQEEMEKIINNIIQDRLIDGQLSDSPLTQKDLKVIAQTFVRVLKGMQHQRIKYPENIMKKLENKVNQIQEIKAQLPEEQKNQEEENDN